MENNTKNKIPWYKNGRVIAIIFVIGFLSLIGIIDSSKIETTTPVSTYNDNQTGQVKSNTVTTPSYNSYSANAYRAVETTIPTTNNLSNNNYYTNTYGNEVHSPAYSNSVPAGASAKCGDGTYSFSQSRRGTCSHHGGVSEWL